MGKGLSLGVSEGRVIYLGDIPLTVVSISPQKDEMVVSARGIDYTIDSVDYTEVVPDVYVGVGLPERGKTRTQAHILISAPRSVVILRDNNRDKKIGNYLPYQ